MNREKITNKKTNKVKLSLKISMKLLCIPQNMASSLL